jgi:hypothetical protein
MRALLAVALAAGCARGTLEDVDAAPSGPDAPVFLDARPLPDAPIPPDAPPPPDAAPRPDAPLTFDAAVPDAAVPDARPDAGPTFPVDTDTLAALEFETNVQDSSGNGRHPVYIGGTLVGGALVFQEPAVGQEPMTGFDWTEHAELLEHPFTIEVVFSTNHVGEYQKIFGHDDASDNGWYVSNEAKLAVWNGELTSFGAVTAGAAHYAAFVSASAITMDVWLDGQHAGVTVPLSFTAPPPRAIFFRDDTATARQEWLRGGVSAVRISKKARTQQEIQAQWQRLQP